MARKERTYPREVFFGAYGMGPHECFFCRESSVEFGTVVVHHINEDRACNHPYNLAPAHLGCHNRWHNALRKGVPRNAIMQEHLRTLNVGRTLTTEHRAAIGSGLKGNRNRRGKSWTPPDDWGGRLGRQNAPRGPDGRYLPNSRSGQ